MVYKNNERISDLDDDEMMVMESDMYDADDDAADTFGERLGDDTLEDELAADETIKPADSIETGFGEAIGHEDVTDQLDDTQLGEEAEADYDMMPDGSIRKTTTEG